MRKRRNMAIIVGVFTLFLVIVVGIMNDPAWLKKETLQTCEYTTIEPGGDELHFFMERYSCPSAECFPQSWDGMTFRHTHFTVTMRHADMDGDPIDTIKREFVHIEGRDLIIGEDLTPVDLINLVLSEYGKQEGEKDPVNRGKVSSADLPRWGDTVTDVYYMPYNPKDDPTNKPGYNPGLGRNGDQ